MRLGIRAADDRFTGQLPKSLASGRKRSISPSRAINQQAMSIPWTASSDLHSRRALRRVLRPFVRAKGTCRETGSVDEVALWIVRPSITHGDRTLHGGAAHDHVIAL